MHTQAHSQNMTLQIMKLVLQNINERKMTFRIKSTIEIMAVIVFYLHKTCTLYYETHCESLQGSSHFNLLASSHQTWIQCKRLFSRTYGLIMSSSKYIHKFAENLPQHQSFILAFHIPQWLRKVTGDRPPQKQVSSYSLHNIIDG